MKKLGFTLAEVLITLLIIGVVATLTAPALINNVGDAKVGPQLAKFVNTFENAMQDVFLDESISSISEFGDITTSSAYIHALAKYMVMAPVTDMEKLDLRDADGNSRNFSSPYSYDSVWQLKDGTLIQLTSTPDAGYYAWAGNPKGAYSSPVVSILVDIGGMKGQHRAGKEVFMFIVDNKGMLVPYGSKTHKWLSTKAKNRTCSKSGSDIWANLACTGEIADNGYKKSSK